MYSSVTLTVNSHGEQTYKLITLPEMSSQAKLQSMLTPTSQLITTYGD